MFLDRSWNGGSGLLANFHFLQPQLQLFDLAGEPLRARTKLYPL
jgi:hypothetical protein